MKRNHAHAGFSSLACDSCGRMPEPTRTRRTLAEVLAILPIELVVHALVVDTELPYLAKVALLAATATVLVIWVTQPSVHRLFARWLHAPVLRQRARLDVAPALWSVRVTIANSPGALRRLTAGVTRLRANIVAIETLSSSSNGVVDHLIVETDPDLPEGRLHAALTEGGARSLRLQRTTPQMVVDGQTRALSAAIQVVTDPDVLPDVIAAYLDAEPSSEGEMAAGGAATLRVPGVGGLPLWFTRNGAPFTPAESARAHRLAELAETVVLSRLAAATSAAGSTDANLP
jgi:hypothetical protein